MISSRLLSYTVPTERLEVAMEFGTTKKPFASAWLNSVSQPVRAADEIGLRRTNLPACIQQLGFGAGSQIGFSSSSS